MKRLIATWLILLFVSTTAWAGGKDAFLKDCGSCHKSGGKASPVNPADKAASVWKKYFKRKRHPVDISSIPPAELSEILKYLQQHAADSDQPEAAAIPK